MRRYRLLAGPTMLAVALVASPSLARRVFSPEPVTEVQSSNATSLDVDASATRLFSRAVSNTTWLASYTFDSGALCSPQTWTSVDLTAQPNYFHVDDFAGLGGGVFGHLYPLEGSQSMWCGARPDPGDPELCQYAALPGYGNSWNQTFCTAACLSAIGDVHFDYLISYETEPGYDEVYIEFDHCDDNWTIARQFDGYRSREFFAEVHAAAAHSGNVRARFRFTSDGAWSDQDGLWNTDGAMIVDSVTVSDGSGVLLPTELFESESVGALTLISGNWASCNIPGFGNFAGLFPGVDAVQEDPCVSNISCLWGFFAGSTYNYACGGYPLQPAVPYIDGSRYLQNQVRSPQIPLVGSGTDVYFSFDVYRDLKADALIFYTWWVRGYVGGTCPSAWKKRDSFYYGEEKDWFHSNNIVTDLLPVGATQVQFALMAHDACAYWCGTLGTGACHSHAPLFDNVSVYRVDTSSPQWSVGALQLFQDTFAQDGTLTGTARADMAQDKLSGSNPLILQGDSVAVSVSDVDGQLGGDPHTGFGPAVYCYVSVWPPQSGKAGAALSDDSFRWPVVDSLSHNGATWYCLRMDTVFGDPGRVTPQQNRYCVDLNDNLFTPGDTICFVFAATRSTPSTATSYYTEFTGATEAQNDAFDFPMEFTVLPAGGYARGGDILYIDGDDGSGAQATFEFALRSLGLEGKVDRFDVRQPSSLGANRPAAHVKNVLQQLIAPYRTIIWSTGAQSNTLGDGANGTKSDDYAMLRQFLDLHPGVAGVYLNGDDVVAEWSYSTEAAAVGLKNTYCSFTLATSDHRNAGYSVSPLALGEIGSFFHHVSTGADSFSVWAGCAPLRDFDVLTAGGTATSQMAYQTGAQQGTAVVGQQSVNPNLQNVAVVLSGFGLESVSGVDNGEFARHHHLGDVLAALSNAQSPPTGARPEPYRTHLAQNYPNPFNPTTTIEFTLRKRARVRVTIYNVAGQRVRTLVDEVRDTGVVHRLEWDGRDPSGATVSSGVYFYRLSGSGDVITRKMVLLK